MTAERNQNASWGNPNNGSASPAQYQQARQSPGVGTSPQQAQSQMAPSPPQPQPQQVRPARSHTRSSSFFSFRKSNSEKQLPQRAFSTVQQRSSPTGANNFDEYGRLQPSVPNKLRHSPPTNTASQQGRPMLETATQGPIMPVPQPLHPEIRSMIQLNLAHAHKIYFSGPLVRRIERQADGQRPAKDEGWTDVWGQLGGTTLSIWDMKQIEEASKQGKEVPPTYVNITDAFLQVLGSVTVPATVNTPAKRYSNVLTLNTAGSNLLLFSCPTPAALISWAAALRLSAWEKCRLEEIYTAHIIRICLSAPNTPSPLINGHMEGWVRIRVAGQTDWKQMWMVLNSPSPNAPTSAAAPTSMKGKRTSIFGRDSTPAKAPPPPKPKISLYSSPKPKDMKKATLTMGQVTQAFAMYPERPELITRSTLMKVEGTLGDEHAAGGMRSREAWLLVMPETEGTGMQAADMLRWVIALHDAFSLYGRPQSYTWDPRDPVSLMFAYPVGPNKDLLFLDREVAETLDPRDDRTSFVRSRLVNILHERRRIAEQPQSPTGASPLSPSGEQPQQPDRAASGPQLPPLTFDASPQPTQPTSQERPAQMTGPSDQLSAPQPLHVEPMENQRQQNSTVFNRPLNSSPRPASADNQVGRRSQDSANRPGMSDSRLGYAGINEAGPTPNSMNLHILAALPAHTPPTASNASAANRNVSPQQLVSPGSSSSSSYALSDPPVGNQYPFPSSPSKPQPSEEPLNFSDEAGALYYMQQMESSDNPRRRPATISEREDENVSEYDDNTQHNTQPTGLHDDAVPGPGSGRNQSSSQGVIADNQHVIDSEPLQQGNENGGNINPPGEQQSPHMSNRRPTSSQDQGLDEYKAALVFLATSDPNPAPQNTQAVVPTEVSPPPPTPPLQEMALSSSEGPDGTAYRSSFAPSKQAAERKARSEAHQAAHHAAVHKPGRSNGKRRAKNTEGGAWNESSEDEEEEEEEDDDVDSDVDPASGSNAQHSAPSQPVQNGHNKPQTQVPIALPSAADVQPAPLRPVRHLPQIPTGRSPSEDYPRRQASEMAEAGRRAYHDEGGPHIRSQSEFPQPGAARQSVWSQVLDPGRNPGPPPELSSNRDTFVQLDPPVMTKAFAPQGLLSAGLQDKQDRSAKRQEELARESGASLINVPNKPPPPQTGLLGAISAHERERKRDGGVGAALTEREREKRLAEEKQRRFDEQQRQQMNQLAQGGSMYGAQGYNPMMPNAMMMGMNPMMGVNPMMTGAPMNPMMTNPVGYPGMMTGYNPQHMFAAQQAAQAYQQAMMAYSVANSQAGGDGTGGMAQPMAQPMAPMMTGTNMAMFDPRMSMMSMPMMGAPMGTTMGGMGMPMGGTTMTQPLGMQMTGGSGFDGRMSPQDPNAGLLPPAQALGAGPGQFSSPNSSAGGRGSPLARPPTESIDSNARPSRQNSPRPL